MTHTYARRARKRPSSRLVQPVWRELARIQCEGAASFRVLLPPGRANDVRHGSTWIEIAGDRKIRAVVLVMGRNT